MTEYDYSTLASRLRDLAFLNAGIKLTLTDRRVTDAGEATSRAKTFYSRPAAFSTGGGGHTVDNGV